MVVRLQISQSQTQKEIRATHHCIGHCTDHARKVLEAEGWVAEYADTVASVGLEVDLGHRVIVRVVPLNWGY